MNGPLRSGGRAILPTGATVVWSVAEGIRGRRWRESVVLHDELVSALLVEVSANGRPTRLELTTTAGLLTLHPEGDERELHGNVVTLDGVRHLRFDWSLEHELLVVDSAVAGAVVLHRAAGAIPIGEGRRVPVLRIDATLEPATTTWRITRTDVGGWHLRCLETDEERTLIVDDDGIPVLPGAIDWPLEIA